MADRLGPADTQPVRASRELSAEAKLVWMEDWTLDRGGEGCWLTHAQLGERLGMSENAVRLQRTRLAEQGLYERIKRPGARSPGWRPRLPEGLGSLGSQRPSPVEVAKARLYLDLHLQGEAVRATASPGARDRLRRSVGPVEPVPGTTSRSPSTAFDSQDVKRPSTAFDVEGHRDRAFAPEGEAVDRTAETPTQDSESNSDSDFTPRPIDQRPRKEVESEGWEKLREKLNERKRQAGTA